MSKSLYLPVVVAEANRVGIDPVMFAAQIQQESAWKPDAKSSANARGIAQFIPATAKAYNVDVTDPVSSIKGAANYMADLKKQFNGDESLARMAYNAGPGTVQKYLAGKRSLPLETVNYNKSIDKIAGGLAKEMGAAAPVAAPMPAGPTMPPVDQMGNPTGQQAAAKPAQPGTGPMDTGQALQLAMAEINQGLPPGALTGGGEQAQQPAQQPAGNMDWLAKLQNINPVSSNLANANTTSNEDMLSGLQDQAAQQQDQVLGQMFADMGNQQPKQETSRLPGAVDRYIERILS